MYYPEPHSTAFPALMNDIEKGLVKIPQFQRDFVWTKEKSAYLLDSMLKGFPIGTFILWKTKESLRVIRNIGGAKLPDTPEGDFTEYVLDGQQRLTSLYASARGLKIERDERTDDFSQIYIDLDADENGAIVTLDVNGRTKSSLISIAKLMNAELSLLFSYPQQHHTKLSDYKRRLESYLFSLILVKEAPLHVATEIFTRINVTGRPLSVFEIMVAKTFDAKKDFDLAEKYDGLVAELSNVSYDTVPPATILQTISILLVKECSKKDILELDKSAFIDMWPKAADAICAAVDYFRGFYRIPVSRLLPYAALLIPFAYFFANHPDRPTGDKQRHLQDFFWRISLGGRYSHSLESRVSQDIRRIDQILKGRLPKYDTPIDSSAHFILQNGWFSTGRSFIKAILCLLAYKQPKSYVDNAVVHISNDWLKQANSRNYHHFFPRAYLETQGWSRQEINQVANISIVDDFLNKRLIAAKAPSRYMKTFAKENPDIDATMATHLIRLNSYGIWENDYQRFIESRASAISRELGKRIIRQDIDNLGQQVSTDDYEEAEFEEVVA